MTCGSVLPLAVLLGLPSPSQAQSIVSLSLKPQYCTYRNAIDLTRFRNNLFHCVADCLEQKHGECKTIEWNPGARRCVSFAGNAYSDRPGNCWLLTKGYEIRLPDSLCAEEMRSRRFKRTLLLPWADSLQSCRFACFLMGYCEGVEWDSDAQRCSWSGGTTVKGKPQKGVTIIKMDKRSCEPRCIVLRARVRPYRVDAHTKRNNLMACLDLLLTNKAIVVDWNVEQSRCWILKGRPQGKWVYSTGHYQFENICNRGSGARICLFLRKNCKMEGGMLIESIKKEAECVRLCEVTRNCIAVGWGLKNKECFFHFVFSTLRSTQDYRAYHSRIDCSEAEKQRASIGIDDDDVADDDEDISRTQVAFRTITDAQCKAFCRVCKCSSFLFKQVCRHR